MASQLRYRRRKRPSGLNKRVQQVIGTCYLLGTL
jgi:hypothetical protein